MNRQSGKSRTRRSSGARAAALATTLALLACAASPAPSVAKGKPASLYWGAQIGSQLTGGQAPWDIAPVYKFQGIAGRGLSLVEFSAPFADCDPAPCLFGRFPSEPLENVRRYGAIPVFSWNSSSSPTVVPDPDFELSDIIDGSFDAYIRYFATSAKAWGHPFFLRFNWEMNGFWFPWSEGVNRNGKGEFVAAWRHVHDIFTAAGATNATWVWCPNVDTAKTLTNLRSLYPGDSYVDWTGLDGFNWGDRHGSPGWLSFNQIFGTSYNQIVHKVAPSKPMLIAEMASSDRGGSKPSWIKDMLHKVRTSYRKVRGIIWYDENDRGTNWPLETSQKASAAFRKGIGNPAYRPNLYGGIDEAPISPPAPRP
jgi:hypothetical protein